LNFAAVVLVATLGGEVGGLVGYAIGFRWGPQLLERPGKHQAYRQSMVDKGQEAYSRWGRFAVFVTPAIVSGTAKMRHGEFVLWNGLAALAFSLGVAGSAYGIGRIVTGHESAEDLAVLLVGLATTVLIVLWVRHRHRHDARQPQP
jgi:membrane protein DedA with SNARE-associated domain